MSFIDYTILAVLLISAAISLVRGFLREMLSLISWVATVWLAIHFSPDLMQFIRPYIESEMISKIISFVALFVVLLIGFSLVSAFFNEMMKESGIGGTDKFLGIFFGLARGAAVMVAIVYFAESTSFPQEDWWRESMLIEHFQGMASWMKSELPSNLKTGFALN
ncbi:MAG: CvpA family protein [Gammaproteobacteria bacterium]|nr:CvpA family protein [Gammaproteobacteria bacterium]MDH5693357.1 CvpA family protein [Gammaproteobacteria bacterium]